MLYEKNLYDIAQLYKTLFNSYKFYIKVMSVYMRDYLVSLRANLKQEIRE